MDNVRFFTQNVHSLQTTIVESMPNNTDIAFIACERKKQRHHHFADSGTHSHESSLI